MSFLSNPKVVRNAAYAAALLFAITMVLQILLAAGILPVTMAWGGRQEVLTSSLRISSIVAVVILGLFAYVILLRAGVVGTAPVSTLIKILSWIITAYMALNTLGNLTSTSSAEQLVFGPITILLVISCLIVSLSPTE